MRAQSMELGGRFVRQVQMKDVGKEGQELLAKAHVAVIGAGGLGVPVLTYLAMAGVANVSLWDYDVVQESNLNRQFFYTSKNVGQKKAPLALAALRALNPQGHYEAKIEKVTAETFRNLDTVFDCIVLCVDKLATRLAINAYALERGVPVVDGGVDGNYGYVYAMLQGKKSACLGCLHGQAVEKQGPIDAWGPVCGLVGSLQATACLEILLGRGQNYAHAFLQFDALRGELERVPMVAHPQCEFCVDKNYPRI